VPLAVLALAASVPRLPRRLRAVVLLLLPVAAVVPSLQQVATGGRLPPVGALPGVLVLVLALALVVPVVARAVAERDRALGLLLALSLPAALVSVPVFAAMTLSGTTWGVAAIGAAPAVTALVVGWASTVGRAWPRVARAASGLLVVAVAVLLTLTPFRDPFPWALDTRISSGAFAGTRTTAESAVYIDAVRESAARWTRPGDAVLFYGVPAGPLLVDAPVASNILWLADFGPAGQVTVDWFTRTGRTPAVAFLDAGLVVREGGLPKLAERDPLVAHLLDRYRIVEAGRAFAGPVVLVRR
jgi:hypothetical protein